MMRLVLALMLVYLAGTAGLALAYGRQFFINDVIAFAIFAAILLLVRATYGGIDDERDRRWRQLADCYLAQQLSLYPRDYIRRDGPPERLLETVERFEEDMTDKARVHGPLKITIEIGEAIQVSPKRVKGVKTDPLMSELEQRLSSMLQRSAADFATGTNPANSDAEAETVLKQ